MLNRVLEMGKVYAEEILEKGDIAIDATLGNGHDTLFLLEIDKLSKIYSFDIQKEALLSSTEKIKNHPDFKNVELILDGHENVKQHVTESVKVALFNLGYLPNGDKSITTLPETTLKSIEDILDLLLPGGRIILTVYHGHSVGKLERDALLEYVSTLGQKYYNVLRYQFINQQNHAPFLIVIEKKKRK